MFAMLVSVLAVAFAWMLSSAAADERLQPTPDIERGWELNEADRAQSAFSNLAADDDVAHMAFGDGRVQYRRSLDQGLTWQSRTDLGRGTLYLEDPIATDGAIVAVVMVAADEPVSDFVGERWVGDLYLRLSRDGGASWEPRRRVTRGARALRVSLAMANGVMHLSWMDFRRGLWDAYYARSVDGGATWQETIVALGANVVGAERPTIAASGDAVHLAWMDARDNLPRCQIEQGAVLPHCTEIYYARSLDGGSTWEPARRLTNDLPYSGRPDIEAIGSTVLIAYDTRVESNDVALLQSTDEGATWTERMLSAAMGDQTHGRIVGDDRGLYATWLDLAGDGPKLYYSHAAGGAPWSPPEEIPSSGGAGAPAMAITSESVLVGWSNPGVKYARRPR